LVTNSDNVIDRFNMYLENNFFSNFYKDSLLDEIVQLFNSQISKRSMNHILSNTVLGQ